MHCTRQKSDLHISSVQKSVGQKSIQYVGSVLGNRTFCPFPGRFTTWTFRHQDVSPPRHFTPGTFRPWTFHPLTGRFAPDCGRFGPVYFSMCLLFFFIWATLPELIKLIGWCTDVLSLLSSHCTFTQLNATLLNFVETSTQMKTLSMLSKLTSIINCLFISCEIVMPRSWKCCTLSTMTGLLVEQSDKCWGRHFARWPRIMKCLSSFCLGCPRSATAEGMSACEFAMNRPRGRILSSWYRPHTYGWGSQQWDHQLVAKRKVDLRGTLEAYQRLCRASQSPCTRIVLTVWQRQLR